MNQACLGRAAVWRITKISKDLFLIFQKIESGTLTADEALALFKYEFRKSSGVLNDGDMRAQLKQIWDITANDNISQTVNNLKVSDVKDLLDEKLDLYFQKDLFEFIDDVDNGFLNLVQ